MLKHHVFWLQFVVLAVVAALHSLGVYLDWYWELTWLDMVTHTLGGLWVALAALWLAYFSGVSQFKFPRKRMLLVAVGSALVVGILWEVFEVIVAVPTEQNYYLDTATDILLDSIGGFVVYVIAQKYYGKT